MLLVNRYFESVFINKFIDSSVNALVQSTSVCLQTITVESHECTESLCPCDTLMHTMRGLMSSPSVVGDLKNDGVSVVDVSVSRLKMSGLEAHLILYEAGQFCLIVYTGSVYSFCQFTNCIIRTKLLVFCVPQWLLPTLSMYLFPSNYTFKSCEFPSQ